MNRKILVYIATSAEGYIARSDGSVDWLASRPPSKYGFGAFTRSVDTILWGRRTYDQGLAMGYAGEFGAKFKNYVFSHKSAASSEPNVQFISEPIGPFAKRLRGEAGKDIWMMGGGGLIASFLDEGEIDEFLIHVVPVFIGEGIPLIQPRHRMVELELASVKRFSDGVVKLRYLVIGREKSGVA